MTMSTVVGKQSSYMRTSFAGSSYVWFGANLQMDGSVSVAVPQETLGTVDCHGGCAPFLDDAIPSVATTRDADLKISMSSASTGSSESLPRSVIQTHPLHGRWIGAARANF